MAIKINNQDLQARYINGNSVIKVMLNYEQIRPAVIPPVSNEYIEYQCISHTTTVSWETRHSIYVPVGWVGHNWVDVYNPSLVTTHNRRVSVDWGEEVQHNSETWAFAVRVDEAWTHTVKIRPVVEEYWRALAYSWWFQSDAIKDSLRDIIYDWSYMWYAVSATNTWDWFRAYQYARTNTRHHLRFTHPAQETMPATVTTIWDYFMYCMYQNGEQLTSSSTEVMSSSVTTIWNYFSYRQYYYCGDLTLWSGLSEAMWNSVTTIWNSYREWQFSGCNSNVNPLAEVMSSNVTSIGNNFRSWQYAGNDIITAASEVLPNRLLTIWWWFREYQYFNCDITTTPVEVLPDSVTSVWFSYREYQYSGCPVSTISWWKDNGFNLSRYHQFWYYIDPMTITMIWDVWPSDYTDTINTDFTTTTVYVPNAYISNYRDSTLEPWVYIPDANFIWY